MLSLFLRYFLYCIVVGGGIYFIGSAPPCASFCENCTYAANNATVYGIPIVSSHFLLSFSPLSLSVSLSLSSKQTIFHAYLYSGPSVATDTHQLKALQPLPYEIPASSLIEFSVMLLDYFNQTTQGRSFTDIREIFVIASGGASIKGVVHV